MDSLVLKWIHPSVVLVGSDISLTLASFLKSQPIHLCSGLLVGLGGLSSNSSLMSSCIIFSNTSSKVTRPRKEASAGSLSCFFRQCLASSGLLDTSAICTCPTSNISSNTSKDSSGDTTSGCSRDRDLMGFFSVGSTYSMEALSRHSIVQYAV